MPPRPKIIKRWQLQEAKAKFSLVVDEALAHGPQIITRHGKAVAVVQSLEEFQKTQPKAKKRESLVEFLMRAPVGGVKLDLKRDRDYGREPPDFS